MAKVDSKTILQLVGQYSDALGRFGPDSLEVRRLREANADNREFLEYADALDRVKRHLGGSGMDAKAKQASNLDPKPASC